MHIVNIVALGDKTTTTRVPAPQMIGTIAADPFRVYDDKMFRVPFVRNPVVLLCLCGAAAKAVQEDDEREAGCIIKIGGKIEQISPAASIDGHRSIEPVGLTARILLAVGK
jgi:hypothetical protein